MTRRFFEHLFMGGLFVGIAIGILVSQAEVGNASAAQIRPSNGTYLLAWWAGLALMYATCRIWMSRSRQLKALRAKAVANMVRLVGGAMSPVRAAQFQNHSTFALRYWPIWVGAFFRILIGHWAGWIGLGCLFYFFVAKSWVGAILVGCAPVALIASRWTHNVAKRRKLIAENNAAIAEWLAQASSGSERLARLGYISTNALLLGAEAAGVKAYPEAPVLTWPEGLAAESYSFNGKTGRYEYPVAFDVMPFRPADYSASFDDDDASIGDVNPATGLPMIGGSMVDAGGNPYGMKNSP